MLLSMRRARSCGDGDGDGVGDPFTAWKAARRVAAMWFALMPVGRVVFQMNARYVNVVLL
jgi:hypothetical protein